MSTAQLIDQYWKLVNEATTKAAKWLSDGTQSYVNIETGMVEHYWSNQDARKVYDHFMSIASHYRAQINEIERKQDLHFQNAFANVQSQIVKEDGKPRELTLKDLEEFAIKFKEQTSRHYDGKKIENICDEPPMWQTEYEGISMKKPYMFGRGVDIRYNPMLGDRTMMDVANHVVHTGNMYPFYFRFSTNLDDNVSRACQHAMKEIAKSIDRKVEQALLDSETQYQEMVKNNNPKLNPWMPYHEKKTLDKLMGRK